MKDYVIQPREEGKGRSFQATCVAVVTADALFPEAKTDARTRPVRPVWAMFAGTDSELRAFMTNLRMGRKAQEPGYGKKGDSDRLEFLRSVGFLTCWQREPEGCLATIYHPELFRLDPGMVDPTGLRFVLMVPADWSDAQRVDVKAAVRHVQRLYPRADEGLLASLVPTAYLFAAYLDRRTRCPLVADGRFYLQLLVAALDTKLASLPGANPKYHVDRSEWGHARHHGFDAEVGGGYRETLDAVGIRHAISFIATHETFDPFLAAQVAIFFQNAKSVRRAGAIDLTRFRAAPGT